MSLPPSAHTTSFTFTNHFTATKTFIPKSLYSLTQNQPITTMQSAIYTVCLLATSRSLENAALRLAKAPLLTYFFFTYLAQWLLPAPLSKSWFPLCT